MHTYTRKHAHSLGGSFTDKLPGFSHNRRANFVHGEADAPQEPMKQSSEISDAQGGPASSSAGDQEGGSRAFPVGDPGGGSRALLAAATGEGGSILDESSFNGSSEEGAAKT